MDALVKIPALMEVLQGHPDNMDHRRLEEQEITHLQHHLPPSLGRAPQLRPSHGSSRLGVWQPHQPRLQLHLNHGRQLELDTEHRLLLLLQPSLGRLPPPQSHGKQHGRTRKHHHHPPTRHPRRFLQRPRLQQQLQQLAADPMFMSISAHSAQASPEPWLQQRHPQHTNMERQLLPTRSLHHRQFPSVWVSRWWWHCTTMTLSRMAI